MENNEIDKIAMYENDWLSFLQNTPNLPESYSMTDFLDGKKLSTYRAYCNVESESFNGEIGVYLAIPGYYYGVWSNPECPELVDNTHYQTAADAYSALMDVIKSKNLTVVDE